MFNNIMRDFQFPSLTTLHLNAFTDIIDDKPYIFNTPNFKQITTLKLTHFDNHVSYLLEFAKTVKTLDIKSSKFQQFSTFPIPLVTSNVRYLYMQDVTISIDGLKILCESLEIIHAIDVTFDKLFDITFVFNCNIIRDIYFVNCSPSVVYASPFPYGERCSVVIK